MNNSISKVERALEDGKSVISKIFEVNYSTTNTMNFLANTSSNIDDNITKSKNILKTYIYVGVGEESRRSAGESRRAR